MRTCPLDPCCVFLCCDYWPPLSLPRITAAHVARVIRGAAQCKGIRRNWRWSFQIEQQVANLTTHLLEKQSERGQFDVCVIEDNVTLRDTKAILTGT